MNNLELFNPLSRKSGGNGVTCLSSNHDPRTNQGLLSLLVKPNPPGLKKTQVRGKPSDHFGHLRNVTKVYVFDFIYPNVSFG